MYFILSKEGFEIGTDPLLLTDHLLLYFCLSLLENPLCLNISNTVRARGNFEAFMRLKLDNSQFDLKDFIQRYQAFSVNWKGQKDDDLVKDFTFKMLSCCKSIENLVLCSSFPFTELLSLMNPMLSTLQKIQIGDLIVPADVDVPLATRENEIDILVNDLSDSNIEKLLKTFSQTGKRLCIYVICSKGTFFDLTILFQPKVKRIHIHQIGEDEIDLLVDREIPECPVEFLHLSSPSVKVGKDVFSALSKAVQEGKLAHLSHLYLVKLFQASGMFPHLFECQWPNLTHLDMSDIQLDVGDVKCLREYIFSKLTSLSVFDPLGVDRNFLGDSLTNLKKLRLNHAVEGPFFQALIEGKVPNVTELVLLSRNSQNVQLFVSAHSPKHTHLKLSPMARQGIHFKAIAAKMNMGQLVKLDLTRVTIWDELSKVVRSKLPCLKSLVLSNCSLMPGDLRLLANGNERGHLPNLQYLDLSKNSCLLDVWDEVFGNDNKWKKLTNLNVSTLGSASTSYGKTTDFQIVANADYFPKLKQLSFSVQNNDFHQNDLKVIWQQLDTIEVYSNFNLDQVLKPIVQVHKMGLFPSLRIVRVCDPSSCPTPPHTSALKQELRGNGVTLQFVNVNPRY